METRINISELKAASGDLTKELAELMKEKTKADVETTTSEIIVKGEGKAVSKVYVRVLLRKFLHKQELRESFRVIGGKENTLTLKEIKIREEE